MSGAMEGTNGSQIVCIAICDSREFDRLALAEATSNRDVSVSLATDNPATLLSTLRAERHVPVIVLGSRVLRQNPDLVRSIRIIHPAARVLVVGVDVSSLRRSIERWGLDGHLRRDAGIDHISGSVRAAAAQV